MLLNGSIEKSKVDNYNSVNQIPCGLKTRLYIKSYLPVHTRQNKQMNE